MKHMRAVYTGSVYRASVKYDIRISSMPILSILSSYAAGGVVCSQWLSWWRGAGIYRRCFGRWQWWCRITHSSPKYLFSLSVSPTPRRSPRRLLPRSSCPPNSSLRRYFCATLYSYARWHHFVCDRNDVANSEWISYCAQLTSQPNALIVDVKIFKKHRPISYYSSNVYFQNIKYYLIGILVSKH